MFFEATNDVPYPPEQPSLRFRSLTPAPESSSDSEQSSDSDTFVDYDDNDDNEFDNIRPVFRRSNSCPPNLVSNLKSDDLRITLFRKRYNNV
jgi:hypothetical protein